MYSKNRVAHTSDGASIADFLIAEIEKKKKKGVGMGGKNSPLMPGPWKGVPKGTSGMP